MSSEWRSWQSWDRCLPSAIAKDAKGESANWRLKTKERTDIGSNSDRRRWEQSMGTEQGWKSAWEAGPFCHTQTADYTFIPRGKDWRFCSIEKVNQEGSSQEYCAEWKSERRGIRGKFEQWDSRAHETWFLDCRPTWQTDREETGGSFTGEMEQKKDL